MAIAVVKPVKIDYLDDPFENNRRLIAIIQWLNGEDVFEVVEIDGDGNEVG